MAYSKQFWENLPSTTTPLSAQRLNHLETQYDEAVGESKDYTDNSLTDYPTKDEVHDEIIDIVNNLPGEAGDFIGYLDHAKVASVFPVAKIASEGYTAMQGFSIDSDRDRMYVSYGSTSTDTTQRIERRSLKSGDLIDYRVLPADTQSYSESLPWFFNSNEELCFIVWTKGAHVSPPAYNIYNWDLDSLSANIEIKGRVRGDFFGNQFVTSDAYGDTANKWYTYDWESVKSGTPNQTGEYSMSVAGPTPEKVQGLTTVGSHFLLYMGKPGGNPTVSVYGNTGVLLSVHQWSRSEFSRIVTATSDYQITNNEFIHEAEGICNEDGVIYSMHYISDLSLGGSPVNRYGVVLRHGDKTSPKMKPSAPIDYFPGEWIDVTPNPSKVTVSALGFKVRITGDYLDFFGRVNGISGGLPVGEHVIGTVSDPLHRPLQAQMFVAAGSGSNPPVLVKVSVEPSGEIKIWPTGNLTFMDLGSIGPVYRF